MGAGPAGSAAAKAAAERGAKTILLEEHRAIGIPQHCSGLLNGTRSGISGKILSTMDPRVNLGEVRVRRIYSPRGRIFDISLDGKGVCLVDRALFDQQLAGQAAKAGAAIQLNTKVTGLITDGQKVFGVTTNTKAVPEIHGKVVIASDGIKSLLGGVPVWAGLSDRVKDVNSGLTMLLFNVRDIDMGVQELHVGAFGSNRHYVGWIWLERIDAYTCLAGFDTVEDFKRCKSGHYPLSRKLKDAVIARLTGFAQPLTVLPQSLPKKVNPGLILAGAAANFPSFLLGLLSGRCAGEVAADAVRNGDVSEDRLSAYHIACKPLEDPGLGKDFHFGSFMYFSEDEQEDLFDKMTKADEVNFDVYSNL